MERFIASGVLARQAGFEFVDVKHCHGYLGHELLGCRDRAGRFGGDLEHRTRFLREVVAGLRRRAPGLLVGVRLSAFDTVPFQPSGDEGTGEPTPVALPYRSGFGVCQDDPTTMDLTETFAFLDLLQRLDIPAGQHHRRQPLLHAAPAAPGAVPAVRRLPAARGSAGGRGAPDRRRARVEAALPGADLRRVGVQLPAGVAARGGGRGGESRPGRFGRAWAA